MPVSNGIPPRIIFESRTTGMQGDRRPHFFGRSVAGSAQKAGAQASRTATIRDER
jgi:hypothetical protein